LPGDSARGDVLDPLAVGARRRPTHGARWLVARGRRIGSADLAHVQFLRHLPSLTPQGVRFR